MVLGGQRVGGRDTPNLLSLSTAVPTSRSASCRVYGPSLLATMGVKSRSRKPRRVWVACSTRTEEMVTGLVELRPIWVAISQSIGRHWIDNEAGCMCTNSACLCWARSYCWWTRAFTSRSLSACTLGSAGCRNLEKS